MTVDFPHEVEVPPQSCTAGQVAHISYHCKDCKLFQPLLYIFLIIYIGNINLSLF